jgi:Arc/MetJ-type ribon-helix-helix transcriptional regulator
MTVPISPERHTFVRELVVSGAFANEEVAVNAAVDLLRQEQEDAQIRAALQPAVEQLERGEYIELDRDGLRALRDEIIARRPLP